ncbi:MAG: hypothetical protein DBY14_03000 [Escherichia coli]|nr:MAG: hypothetical protein DBY14_03000 [Escherichia coli]
MFVFCHKYVITSIQFVQLFLFFINIVDFKITIYYNQYRATEKPHFRRCFISKHTKIMKTGVVFQSW